MVKKILVVDDEMDILESVDMLLSKSGYDVKTVESGKKAIEFLKKDNFDLVLLDILMPKMSGIQTLEQIRADPKIKNQKVAFLTVVSPSANGKGIIDQLKPVEYLQKPIENVSFRKKIKKLVGV
jgi:CheY-like chemotaxis protein